MPSIITARDEEILAALDKTPLTAAQLLALSEIFRNGRFTSERKVRARLHKLAGGPVRQARYGGLAGRVGSPSYYFLNPLGFRMLHGRDIRPHSKHAFNEIGVGRQQHTFAIADFVVQTLRAAHHFQIPVQDFYRENSLKLQIGRERLFPDCSFTLESAGIPFRFMVEIDCGTEPIHSERSVHAWQRKVELYESFADQSEDRFRVLLLSTKNHHRLDAILKLAANKAKNPRRRLFLAAPLDDYLSRQLPLFERSFRDHQGEPTALLPTPAMPLPQAAPSLFPEAIQECATL